ncbi:hypothetical protein [Streptomyces sp. IBSBF 3136]|uniref:hypothetical protein n=1 Tax=Streptomyces sp. IBSBF 3136 TaxID=2903524 RepID=UPI002FDBBDF4
MSEQPAAGSAARKLGEFLESRREQIAQRWADRPLFRTVFTVSLSDGLVHAPAGQGVEVVHRTAGVNPR